MYLTKVILVGYATLVKEKWNITILHIMLCMKGYLGRQKTLSEAIFLISKCFFFNIGTWTSNIPWLHLVLLPLKSGLKGEIIIRSLQCQSMNTRYLKDLVTTFKAQWRGSSGREEMNNISMKVEIEGFGIHHQKGSRHTAHLI